MEPRPDDLAEDDAVLAPVFLLSALARPHDQERDAQVHRESADPMNPQPPDADRAAAVLRRRYGDGWPDLPTDLGRVAVVLESLLVSGPTTVDASAAWTDDDAANAWLVVQTAIEHAEELIEESEVLGEALGTDLTGLPLRQLDQLVEALVSLSAVGGGASRWADPVAAAEARLVLDTYGDDVRRAAELHRDVYERFTGRVWDIRDARLRAGRQRWNLVGRALLRSELAATSRTGKVHGSLRDASELIERARAARSQLADLGPLLERHLGRYHRGPLTDLGPAMVSLDAVIRLQQTVGERLDADRLANLLMADAFATDAVMTAALRLRDALGSWEAEVEQICSGDAWVLPAHELRAWAAEARVVLVPIVGALCDLVERGHPPVSLRDLVDALVLREHGVQAQDTQDPARPENASAS